MSIYKWILIATLIISIIKLKKRKIPKHLFLFVFYVSIIELIAKPYSISIYESNVAISNLFANSCVLYYFFFYSQKIIKGRSNSILLILLQIWLVVWIYRILSFDLNHNIDYITYDLGMIFITLIGLKYLKNFIETNVEENHDYSGLFFTAGIMVFFSTCFPVITFSNYLIISKEVKVAYGDLLQVGNIFLYLGYMGSIICSNKEV